MPAIGVQLLIALMTGLAPVFESLIRGLLGRIGAPDDVAEASSEGLTRAMDLARLHVENMDKASGMPASEKQRHVREAIEADLLRIGLKAESSLVNWLGETAVVAVRGGAGVALLAPSPPPVAAA